MGEADRFILSSDRQSENLAPFGITFRNDDISSIATLGLGQPQFIVSKYAPDSVHNLVRLRLVVFVVVIFNHGRRRTQDRLRNVRLGACHASRFSTCLFCITA